MDIVYSIDDNFIPQAAALTVSILRQEDPSGATHCPGRFSYTFHILSNGITKEHQKRFSEFVRENGAQVYFYDMGDFEGRLERILGAKPETGRYVKAALGRIFAAEYLPSEVKRFLYLDADMIARKSIAELEKLPVPDPEQVHSGSGKLPYIAAAVAEPTIYGNLLVDQGDADRKAYFNTGLLLIDREGWDREGITGKCLAWYTEHNGAFDFADQDILNHVLAGRILPLSQRWNFQTNYHFQSYRSLVQRAPWYGRLITEADYRESAADPVIVHFAGDERPWIRGNRNPYRKEYEQALAQTPWKDTPQTEGREAYMRFYHLVNVLSERIPGFRSIVSKVYYRTKVKKK